MLAEPMAFASLPPAAAAALAKQIEEIAPSAIILESAGLAFQLAQYLASVIHSGEPDLSEMRSQGIDLNTAIAICESISKRHLRKKAVLDAILRAKPLPKQPAAAPPVASELDGMSAVSAMHTLFEELDGPHPCVTRLTREGWSESTAKEISRVAAESRKAQRAVR